jgi:hypothetical protein
MIRELDRVVLTCDVPDYGLAKGDLGTVVLEHGAEGFEVEFVALDGETLAVVSLTREQVRPVEPWEIAHARPISVPRPIP